MQRLVNVALLARQVDHITMCVFMYMLMRIWMYAPVCDLVARTHEGWRREDDHMHVLGGGGGEARRHGRIVRRT